MPKGPDEYTHNDYGKTHTNFLRFKQKKKPNLGKKGS